MSEEQALKAMVDRILDEADEKVAGLFAAKIAEYEEKLRIAREEGQRKQELLDLILNQSFQEVPGGVHLSDLKWEIPETNLIKAEPGAQIKMETGDGGIKQEPRTEFRAVKTEHVLKAKTEDDLKEKDPEAGKTEADWAETFCIIPDSEEDTDNSSDTDKDEDWEPSVSGRSRQWVMKGTPIPPITPKEKKQKYTVEMG